MEALDRLVRSELPARCRAVGLESDAVANENRSKVDRAERVASALADLQALERRLVASWDPTWDKHWSPRTFRAQLVTDVEIGQLDAATADERALFKTSLRVNELLMTRALAARF